MAESTKKITLIGAGLAGSLLSVYLAKRGYQVEIYERRPDMRRTRISAGRSINLALSERGLHALREVGLVDEIMKIAIPMKGRMMHSIEGKLAFQPYGKNEHEVIYSVSRGTLNMKLMDLAEQKAGVKIHFDHRCAGMDFQTGELLLVNEQEGKTLHAAAGCVIGTDGSASAVRLEMQKTGRFNFSQEYLEHGYKELTIPAGPDGAFLLEKNALHIWPRGTYMMIALPNLDGSFTCTLFLPYAGPHGFDALDTPGKVRTFFESQFPDAVPLIPSPETDFFENPTGNLVTVKCGPWHVGGQALLLGDAAHAIVPFFGQGMNCAFEDCIVLNECMSRHGEDFAAVFADFFRLRKRDADAIADLAQENFIEMRDKVASPEFLFRKKVEHLLEERFPEKFTGRYGMVSFTRIPYARAQAIGRKHDMILEELCRGKHELSEIDLSKAEKLIHEHL